MYKSFLRLDYIDKVYFITNIYALIRMNIRNDSPIEVNWSEIIIENNK